MSCYHVGGEMFREAQRQEVDTIKMRAGTHDSKEFILLFQREIALLLTDWRTSVLN